MHDTARENTAGLKHDEVLSWNAKYLLSRSKNLCSESQDCFSHINHLVDIHLANFSFTSNAVLIRPPIQDSPSLIST